MTDCIVSPASDNAITVEAEGGSVTLTIDPKTGITFSDGKKLK